MVHTHNHPPCVYRRSPLVSVPPVLPRRSKTIFVHKPLLRRFQFHQEHVLPIRRAGRASPYSSHISSFVLSCVCNGRSGVADLRCLSPRRCACRFLMCGYSAEYRGAQPLPTRWALRLSSSHPNKGAATSAESGSSRKTTERIQNAEFRERHAVCSCANSGATPPIRRRASAMYSAFSSIPM
jgi:hypothetical protein